MLFGFGAGTAGGGGGVEVGGAAPVMGAFGDGIVEPVGVAGVAGVGDAAVAIFELNVSGTRPGGSG